jgi:DNA-binding ferritin-like protein
MLMVGAMGSLTTFFKVKVHSAHWEAQGVKFDLVQTTSNFTP